MNNTNRVIFNTIILYIKLILGVVLGLITTRFVLDALGDADYGIYILVAGIVGMLSFLSSSMSNTSVRYLAFSLGTGDKNKMLQTFNTTLFLHFIIASIVVIILEIGGWYMFEYLLNIPIEKFSDAKIVFQFMVITTFIAIISVPYDAVMNAHENILALSLFDLLGVLLRLGVAIYLIYAGSSLLVLYGLLHLIIQIFLRVIKQVYSRIKYPECKPQMRKYADKNLVKEIFTFTGWNLFGTLGAMAVTQIRSIIINVFFGVRLNAAGGIANAVSSQVNMVALSMASAINPQLIKSEGYGDRDRMLRLTEISTKFITFLFALVAFPVMLEVNFLLKIWLKEVPQYAGIFIQLLLIAMLIEKLTFQITTSIQAIGNIKIFQIFESTILLLNIPLAYVFFKLNYDAYVIYSVGIFISCLLFFNRLFFGEKLTGLKIVPFLRNGVLKVIIPLLISSILPFMIRNILQEDFFRFLMVTVTFFVFFIVSFWFYGINSGEKIILKPFTNKFQIFFKIINKERIN